MGGIAGSLEAGTIQNCGVQVNIAHTSTSGWLSKCGGIVGQHNSGAYKISNCYSTGSISVTGGTPYAGGICGAISSSSSGVDYCYATGGITADGSVAVYAGGIAGFVENSNKVEHCVALNGSITVSGPSPHVGRVYNFTSVAYSGADNYARNDMTDGSTVIGTANDPTDKDGGDVSMANANTSAWWGTSSPGPDWTIEADGDGADSSPWEWDTDRTLPRLYWE
jgi:hypothetical protein